ncbi:MAG: helix-turn-helix domain-containing protein [Tannerella sp.]|jgi:transcriptional regulator with XRE-family HTH domain|nr:helix-turn-helix domain-containing protein [Tannerella sp.]
MAVTTLKKILIDEGMTQAELATATSLNYSTINRFVNGARTPSPTIANKIINIINDYSGSNGKKKHYTVQGVWPNSKKVKE